SEGDATRLAQATPPAQAGSPTGARDGARTASTTSTSPTSRPRVTAKDMKQWSDLAAQLGFEYSILEGFWSRWPAEELKDLVDSSRAQGVGIFVWVDSKKLRDPEARRALYKTCVENNIAGLKVDFFDHEHKETIDQYHAILRECAEHKLLLNFHGANKPTGESRTWPNELVREAIRGMEARKLESRAVHEATLPFTRFPVGHGEYTGVLFTERRGDTTFAHQIAIPVVFTAPLHTYAAHPSKLLASPAADVIRAIPPVWDQTIVLPPSEIGELAVFARRLGDKWFLGVLNGTKPRQITVPLSFLREGKFTATLVRDGAMPEEMKIEKDVPLSPSDTVTIDMPAGGGFVGAFVKKEE
ncbi:MAG: glycoside hydrolase family 97 catalytic domain-containing protein, partial [Tepidisphaeraceae bacterium]